MRRLWIVALMLLVAAPALAGCVTPAGRTTGQVVDDSTITARVKSGLVAERASNLTRVNVDTRSGVVYLQGNVDTINDRARAEQIALVTPGVTSVVNSLQVTRPAAATTTTPTVVTPSPGQQVVVVQPSAAPRSEARHSVAGQVTDVDHAAGEVTVRATDGSRVRFRLPASAIAGVRAGDDVSVDFVVRPR